MSALAWGRVRDGSVPVTTTVTPASSASLWSTATRSPARRTVLTPAARSSSTTVSVGRRRRTSRPRFRPRWDRCRRWPRETPGPPAASASSESWCAIRSRATVSPTCRMPSPNSSRPSGRDRAASRPASRLSTFLSLKPSRARISSRRAVSRNRSGRSWTSPTSTSWAAILVPMPSMSSALRAATCSMARLSWPGTRPRRGEGRPGPLAARRDERTRGRPSATT